MKHHGAVTFLIAIVLFAATVFKGCAEDSGTTEYEKSTLDTDVVYGILQGIGDIYNQNLAGKSAGDQNVDTDCPMGGKVKITGRTETGSDTGITNVDLGFEMTECKFSVTDLSDDDTLRLTLTLDGILTYKGSFNGSNYMSTNYRSESLKISGTAERSSRAKTDVDETCSFYASVSMDGSESSATGEICGRPVSWSK